MVDSLAAQAHRTDGRGIRSTGPDMMVCAACMDQRSRAHDGILDAFRVRMVMGSRSVVEVALRCTGYCCQ